MTSCIAVHNKSVFYGQGKDVRTHVRQMFAKLCGFKRDHGLAGIADSDTRKNDKLFKKSYFQRLYALIIRKIPYGLGANTNRNRHCIYYTYYAILCTRRRVGALKKNYYNKRKEETGL